MKAYRDYLFYEVAFGEHNLKGIKETNKKICRDARLR